MDPTTMPAIAPPLSPLPPAAAALPVACDPLDVVVGYIGPMDVVMGSLTLEQRVWV